VVSPTSEHRRRLIVIAGLDPVISHGTRIGRREMEGFAQAMTLTRWRTTVRAPRRGYVSAYGVRPGDDGERQMPGWPR